MWKTDSSAKELVQNIYKDSLKKIYNIYNVFIDQFGEEQVDLQDIGSVNQVYNYLEDNEEVTPEKVKEAVANVIFNPYIIVHWPYVKITNEFDKSTDIRDLWAKVTLTKEGTITGRFKLNRSNYSYLHISNSYMHSHINNIPFYDFTEFQKPCTGSGPINQTMNSLCGNYNIDLWRLFCCELNNFVSVESIEGVPYHRLENLGGDCRASDYSTFQIVDYLNSYQTNALSSEDWRKFIAYLIDKEVFNFGYINGEYTLGMPLIKVVLLLSNLFIEWFNTAKYSSTHSLNYLLSNHILKKVTIKGTAIYEPSGSNRDFSEYIGKKVLSFKGKEVKLTIDGMPSENENYSYLLYNNIVWMILTKILRILNFKYGKSYINKERILYI